MITEYSSDQQLLKQLELSEINTENLPEHFKELAYNLMNNFRIKKSDDLYYRILEVEFYWFSQEHQDLITYQRKTKPGDWFFHQSGVDICFGSNCTMNAKGQVSMCDENTCFGGILIRSIEKIKKNETTTPIKGHPQLCCNELFDQFTAFRPTADNIKDFEFPFIEHYEFEQKYDVESKERHFNFSKGERAKYDSIKKDNWAVNTCDVNEIDFKNYLHKPYSFYINKHTIR